MVTLRHPLQQLQQPQRNSDRRWRLPQTKGRPESRPVSLSSTVRLGRQQRRSQQRRQVVITAVVVPLDEVLNNCPYAGERRRGRVH